MLPNPNTRNIVGTFGNREIYISDCRTRRFHLHTTVAYSRSQCAVTLDAWGDVVHNRLDDRDVEHNRLDDRDAGQGPTNWFVLDHYRPLSSPNLPLQKPRVWPGFGSRHPSPPPQQLGAGLWGRARLWWPRAGTS